MSRWVTPKKKRKEKGRKETSLKWVKTQELDPEMEQLTRSKLGKKCDKAIYFHSAYMKCHFAYKTYMQFILSKIMLDESHAGIKVAWRYINNLR